LDRLWFTEASTKIRSGFYVRHVKKDGKDIILINGFHPEQLSHFTDPSHKIVLMLLHSNTDWSVLKNEMVGATFPEKAASESIRGVLHANAKDYGFESVTIANNCVHLSAGPFEAMFEIVNFFGKIVGLDLQKQPPLIMRRMLEAGINYKQAVSALDNPLIISSGKSIDLFTATEDMNTDEAVTLFKKSLS
jgi:nucleoside diphosphate kinase